MSRFIVVDKSAVVFENEMALVKFPDHQKALDAIERVRELHTKEHYIVPGCSEPNCCGDTHEGYQCVGCCEDWPCDTIKALDGETE